LFSGKKTVQYMNMTAVSLRTTIDLQDQTVAVDLEPWDFMQKLLAMLRDVSTNAHELT